MVNKQDFYLVFLRLLILILIFLVKKIKKQTKKYIIYGRIIVEI